MGQEPSFEIPAEDRPRATPGPAPARRWKAVRPGDLHSPAEVPWGGPYGTPGPDTGFAIKLAARAEYALPPGESRSNVEALLVLVMGARASLFGKAPSSDDLAVGLMLLGLDEKEEIPAAVKQRLAQHRRYWAPRVANSNGAARAFSRHLTPDLLGATGDELRHRLALGETPLSP